MRMATSTAAKNFGVRNSPASTATGTYVENGTYVGQIDITQPSKVLPTMIAVAVAGCPQRTNLARPRWYRDMTDRRASTVLWTATVKILRQGRVRGTFSVCGGGPAP